MSFFDCHLQVCVTCFPFLRDCYMDCPTFQANHDLSSSAFFSDWLYIFRFFTCVWYTRTYSTGTVYEKDNNNNYTCISSK